MSAPEETAEESPQPSRATGGCVVLGLVAVVLAAVFAVAVPAGVLAVWGLGVVFLWRAVRRRMSDSSATPPPGGCCPLHDNAPGHSGLCGTTLVHEEGMLIYLTPDPDEANRTHVTVVRKGVNGE